MNVALFGGTFDPVHRGHLAVAQAALADRRFALERVYFVPADVPPHKQGMKMASFQDRCAMLQLALADEARMTVSEIEERSPGDRSPNYSIDTVRRFKRTLGFGDALYFLIGMDSLLQLSLWKDPLLLLREVPFIVANRPGIDRELAMSRLPKEAPLERIHFMPDVYEDVSATAIRDAAQDKDALAALVGPAVARFILEHRLYR